MLSITFVAFERRSTSSIERVCLDTFLFRCVMAKVARIIAAWSALGKVKAMRYFFV